MTQKGARVTAPSTAHEKETFIWSVTMDVGLSVQSRKKVSFRKYLALPHILDQNFKSHEYGMPYIDTEVSTLIPT